MKTDGTSKKEILQYAGQVDFNQKNNAISIGSIVVGFFFPSISSVGLKVVTFTTDSFAPHDWSDGDELGHRKQFTEQKKEKKSCALTHLEQAYAKQIHQKILIQDRVHTTIEIVK